MKAIDTQVKLVHYVLVFINFLAGVVGCERFKWKIDFYEIALAIFYRKKNLFKTYDIVYNKHSHTRLLQS